MPILGFLRRNSDRHVKVDNHYKQNSENRALSKQGGVLMSDESFTDRTVDVSDHSGREIEGEALFNETETETETERSGLFLLQNLRREIQGSNKIEGGGAAAAAEDDDEQEQQQHSNKDVQTDTTIKTKRPSPLQCYEEFDMNEFWANPEGLQAARAKDQRREEQRKFLRWQQHESMQVYLSEIKDHRDELKRLGIPLTKSRYYPSSSGKISTVDLDVSKEIEMSDLPEIVQGITAPVPKTNLKKSANANVSSEQKQQRSSGIPTTILAIRSIAASDLSGMAESTTKVHEQQQLKHSFVPKTISLAAKPSVIAVSARIKFSHVGNDREMKQEAATLFQAKSLLERIRTITSSSSDESEDEEEEEDFSCSMITDSHFGDSDSSEDDSDDSDDENDDDEEEEEDIPVSNLARKLKHVESIRETQMVQNGRKSVFLNVPNGVYCRMESVEGAPYTNEIEC